VILRELLERAADELANVEATHAADGTMTWTCAGHSFAVLSADGSTAEFALDPAVAAAASRTPDAAPSGRGAGWVRFSPIVLDDHAVDRARAWFESAQRRTAGG
jgi:hypothetical protein